MDNRVANLIKPQLCCHLILGIFFIFLCYIYSGNSCKVMVSESIQLIYKIFWFSVVSWPFFLSNYIHNITKCRFLLFVNRRTNNSLSCPCIYLLQILCKYCANIMKILYIYCRIIVKMLRKYFVSIMYFFRIILVNLYASIL